MNGQAAGGSNFKSFVYCDLRKGGLVGREPDLQLRS
jgi:hypothetical protein